MQKCLGLEECNLWCYFWNPKKSVLHEQQEASSFCSEERGFLMRDRHQDARKKFVMLVHTSQTSRSRVMQNVHDKPCNLPDPDIFIFDTTTWETTSSSTVLNVSSANIPGRLESCDAWCCPQRIILKRTVMQMHRQARHFCRAVDSVLRIPRSHFWCVQRVIKRDHLEAQRASILRPYCLKTEKLLAISRHQNGGKKRLLYMFLRGYFMSLTHSPAKWVPLPEPVNKRSLKSELFLFPQSHFSFTIFLVFCFCSF